MERVLKMCLSAVFGAVIGMFVAFALRHAYWWIGMLCGGPVGMFVFSWHEAADASLAAWNALIETLPSAEKWRQFGRKTALIITIFFWWLGWGIVSYLAIYRFFPGLHCGNFELFIEIAPGIACALWLEDQWDGCKNKEKAREVAQKLFNATFPVVLCWQIPRALRWTAMNIRRVLRATLFLARIPFIIVWYVLVAIYSHDGLIVGFSAAIGTAGGYLAHRSYLVGIAVALIFAMTGILFLAKPAKRWMRDYG